MQNQDMFNFMAAYSPYFKNRFPSVDDVTLIKYYNASKYLGYPEEPAGSIFTSEGKAIYVLIRLLKPKKILEIGNFLGRSSNFILKAVDDNGFGDVTLLDIQERLEYGKLHSSKFTRVLDDSLKYLEQPLDFDMYVHDGNHEYAHVKKELELLRANTKNDFTIWSHDYFKILPPQCEVKRAWDEQKDKFATFEAMIEKTSNCGFVIADFKK